MMPQNPIDDGIVTFARNMVQLTAQWRSDREQKRNEKIANERGERDTLEAERKRTEWRKQVERQMSRGSAGNASRDVARAALRSRGGRPNPLDDRLFP